MNILLNINSVYLHYPHFEFSCELLFIRLELYNITKVDIRNGDIGILYLDKVPKLKEVTHIFINNNL